MLLLYVDKRKRCCNLFHHPKHTAFVAYYIIQSKEEQQKYHTFDK